jgi:hypothetical protein
MDQRATAALMGRVAGVIRDYVAQSVSPLADTIKAQQEEIEALRGQIGAQAAAVERMVAEGIESRTPAWIDAATAAMPKPADGVDGKSVTVDDVLPTLRAELASVVAEQDAAITVRIAEAVSALPPARDGQDADPAEIERMVAEKVAAIEIPAPLAPDPADIDRAVAAEVDRRLAGIAERAAAQIVVPEAPAPIEPDMEAIHATIAAEIERVAAGIEIPEPLAPDPDMVERFVAGHVDRAVAALPPAPKGDPGPPGALPLVRDWTDGVHYEGHVVTHAGAVYQAQRDTGREPPHEDWRCVVAAGTKGDPGPSPILRGTWRADEDYSALDVVALNGSSFIAKRDAPGECPGDGWQFMASRGKKGDPGKGEPGRDAKPVVRMSVDGDGLLTLVNGDGSTVPCDLYPVLAKLGR